MSMSSKSHQVGRRDALRFAGVGLLATTAPIVGCRPEPSPLLAQARTDYSVADAPTSKPVCKLTHDNIEGPYYRAGAPERVDLAGSNAVGTRLVVQGCVMTKDCSRPLAGVELDVWQANHEGHYDNDGSMQREDAYLLRGKVRTDANGNYRIRTIVPGRYLNGKTYRPAHIHVKLRNEGVSDFTTQLYFPGDPYNKADPFIHPSLVMDVRRENSLLVARFDFVLSSA